MQFGVDGKGNAPRAILTEPMPLSYYAWRVAQIFGRILSIAAVVYVVREAPEFTSRFWLVAAAAESAEAPSMQEQILLFAASIHENAVSWHALCVLATALIAGVLMRVVTLGECPRSWGMALGTGLMGTVFTDSVARASGLFTVTNVSLAGVGLALAASLLLFAFFRALMRM